MREIVYISGPMTGIPGKNISKFNEVANLLNRKGFEVINPANFGEDHWSWEEFMRKDLSEMLKANCIALLPGWENSKGASLEVYVARQLGYRIEPYENYDEPLHLKLVKLQIENWPEWKKEIYYNLRDSVM